MLTLALLIAIAICFVLVFCIIKIGDVDSIECLVFLSGLAAFVLLMLVLTFTYN